MSKAAPSALLIIAPGCVHCPGVLDSLSRLVKSGLLGKLEVINLAHHPEAVKEYGVKCSPWVRIGLFELEGSHTLDELENWAELAAQHKGFDRFFQLLCETQRAHQVSKLILAHPETLGALIGLIEAPDLPITVKIGIGVVFEDLQGQHLLIEAIPDLERLTNSSEPNIRADAAHYLGLTHSQLALDILNRLLQDDFPDVREIAAESIELLESENNHR